MRLEFIEDNSIPSLPFLHLYIIVYKFMPSSLIDNIPPYALYKFHWIKTQRAYQI